MSANNPLVTIVTIAFNATKEIEQTLLSVLNQTYKNKEYIIIDGGSTDGTMEVVNAYSDRIDVIISEPDDGIYHAMNKAFEKASGEWVGFMNAGDYFFDDKAIEKLIDVRGESRILFGQSLTTDGKSTKLRHADFQLDDDLWYHMKMPNHQAILLHREAFSQERFDIELRVFSDTEFLRRVFGKYPFAYCPSIISVFHLGGRSNYYPKLSQLRDILRESKQLRSGSGVISHLVKFAIQQVLPRKQYLSFYLKYLLK